MKSKCCVKNCSSQVEKKFKFPDPSHNLERTVKWLEVCGNSNLLNLSPHQLKRRDVCEAHFEKKFILNQRLSKTAIPTLNLPESISASGYIIQFKGQLGRKLLDVSNTPNVEPSLSQQDIGVTGTDLPPAKQNPMILEKGKRSPDKPYEIPEVTGANTSSKTVPLNENESNANVQQEEKDVLKRRRAA